MTPGEVASAAQFACLVEASAAKPGNVSPGRPFRDMHYEDFLASAAAIGPALLGAGQQPLGRTILAAIEATRLVTTANTNLGLVLLLAPLVRAALAVQPGESLQGAVRRVVDATTLEDARDAYAAIRLASPGGMGSVGTGDVTTEPTMTLVEAMRLASGRDGVAREWASGFETTFRVGAPAAREARTAGLTWEAAALESFLAILAHQPDTLIERKLGTESAVAVQDRARTLLEETGRGTAARCEALEQLDAALRDDANQRNPGTTADLTAAALFVVIIEPVLHAAMAHPPGE